jgi:hypothetical protein
VEHDAGSDRGQEAAGNVGDKQEPSELLGPNRRLPAEQAASTCLAEQPVGQEEGADEECEPRQLCGRGGQALGERRVLDADRELLDGRSCGLSTKSLDALPSA